MLQPWSLIDAYATGVQNLMEMGADGVFIDNVHPYPACFGAKLGLHTHDWPDRTTSLATKWPCTGFITR